MGIDEEVWLELSQPRPQAHALDNHTPLYTDMFIAVEKLHMLYSDYIASTTPHERLALRLFTALHGLKEKHAIDRAQQEADAKRDAYRAGGVPDNARR